MSIRQFPVQFYALIVVSCAVSQVGCVCMSQMGCGGGGCGMGGQVYDDCCASCGVADTCCDSASCGCPEASCCCPDASCGCPDATCGCPDASCGCPDGCGGGVGCGAPVRGQCRLLTRLRNAICGCSGGCGGPAYWNEWQDCPPCNSNPCDCYGNHLGGTYGSPHKRRGQLARKNLANELQFGEADSETIYR